MDDGCTCQSCGWKFRMDLMLDDSLWDEISEGHNLLCPNCIIARLTGRDGFSAFKLLEL